MSWKRISRIHSASLTVLSLNSWCIRIKSLAHSHRHPSSVIITRKKLQIIMCNSTSKTLFISLFKNYPDINWGTAHTSPQYEVNREIFICKIRKFLLVFSHIGSFTVDFSCVKISTAVYIIICYWSWFILFKKRMVNLHQKNWIHVTKLTIFIEEFTSEGEVQAGSKIEF